MGGDAGAPASGFGAGAGGAGSTVGVGWTGTTVNGSTGAIVRTLVRTTLVVSGKTFVAGAAGFAAPPMMMDFIGSTGLLGAAGLESGSGLNGGNSIGQGANETVWPM